MLIFLTNFEQKKHRKFSKMPKNTVICTKIKKKQRNVQKPFAIYSILCYNTVTRNKQAEMNKLFQNSYFRHDVIPIVFYNVCDGFDKRKGEQYLWPTQKFLLSMMIPT